MHNSSPPTYAKPMLHIGVHNSSPPTYAKPKFETSIDAEIENGSKRIEEQTISPIKQYSVPRVYTYYRSTVHICVRFISGEQFLHNNPK